MIIIKGNNFCLKTFFLFFNSYIILYNILYIIITKSKNNRIFMNQFYSFKESKKKFPLGSLRRLDVTQSLLKITDEFISP